MPIVKPAKCGKTNEQGALASLQSTKTDMFSSVKKLSAAMALIACVSVSGVTAQPYGPGGGGESGVGMMGHDLMGGFGQMCAAGGRDFSDWRITRLERSLKLTEGQREAFEIYKKVSLRASAWVEPQ